MLSCPAWVFTSSFSKQSPYGVAEGYLFGSTVVCQTERCMHTLAARNVTGCE